MRCAASLRSSSYTNGKSSPAALGLPELIASRIRVTSGMAAAALRMIPPRRLFLLRVVFLPKLVGGSIGAIAALPILRIEADALQDGLPAEKLRCLWGNEGNCRSRFPGPFFHCADISVVSRCIPATVRARGSGKPPLILHHYILWRPMRRTHLFLALFVLSVAN